MEYKEIYDGYRVSKSGVLLSKKGKEMSVFDNGKGYLIVQLRYKGKPKVKAIHRLVAEAWIPNPDNLSDVDHIDGDRLNNHIDNLRWVTHGENLAHSFFLENRTAKGEYNGRCKASELEVKVICSLLDIGYSSAEIRDLGFNYNLVRSIKSGKNWRHVSCNFKFSSTFRD